MKRRAARAVTPAEYLVQERSPAGWRTLAKFPDRSRAIVYARALHRHEAAKSYRVIGGDRPGGRVRRRVTARARIARKGGAAASSKLTMRRNPAHRVDPFDAHAAAKLYRRFAGKEADSSAKTRKPAIPDALACIGQVSVIQYIAERDGKVNEYRHPFKVSSRPHLCISPDGKLVLMLGGAFTFTEDGFVDEPSR